MNKNDYLESSMKISQINAIARICLLFCASSATAVEVAIPEEPEQFAWNVVTNAPVWRSSDVVDEVYFNGEPAPSNAVLEVKFIKLNHEKCPPTITAYLVNVSTDNLVVLLRESKFELKWREIQTNNDRYRVLQPVIMRGVFTWPSQSIFIPGRYHAAHVFEIPMPDFNTIDNAVVLDDSIERYSPEEFILRMNDEGFVSGTVDLYCHIIYYVLGDTTRRDKQISRSAAELVRTP